MRYPRNRFRSQVRELLSSKGMVVIALPPAVERCGIERFLPKAQVAPPVAARESDGTWLVRVSTRDIEGDTRDAPMVFTDWTFHVDPKTCVIAGMAATAETSRYEIERPPPNRVTFVGERSDRLVSTLGLDRATFENGAHHEVFALAPPDLPHREETGDDTILVSAPRYADFTAGPPYTRRVYVDHGSELSIAGGSELHEIANGDGWRLLKSEEGGIAFHDIGRNRSAWLCIESGASVRDVSGGFLWLVVEHDSPWEIDRDELLAIDLADGTLRALDVGETIAGSDLRGVQLDDGRVIPWKVLQAKLDR